MAPELTIRWQADRTADGRWTGTFTIPLIGPFATGPALVTARVLSADGYDAQHKAGTLAKQVLTNPLLQALAPPGALPAAQMAVDLLQDLRSGPAHEAIARVPGQLRDAASSMVDRLRHIFGYLPEELDPRADLGRCVGYGYPYGQGGGY